MEKKKENALTEFIKTIKQSWTWERLTEQERSNFLGLINTADSTNPMYVSGTFDNRWRTLNGFYSAFLTGLDYKPTGWRE